MLVQGIQFWEFMVGSNLAHKLALVNVELIQFSAVLEMKPLSTVVLVS